jgi:hypothetical protein
MEQEQVINIDPVEYQQLLDIETKRRALSKAKNMEQYTCELCNINVLRGNRHRHNTSIQHKNKIVLQKLDQIKGTKISRELLDEVKQLLS